MKVMTMSAACAAALAAASPALAQTESAPESRQLAPIAPAGVDADAYCTVAISEVIANWKKSSPEARGDSTVVANAAYIALNFFAGAMTARRGEAEVAPLIGKAKAAFERLDTHGELELAATCMGWSNTALKRVASETGLLDSEGKR